MHAKMIVIRVFGSPAWPGQWDVCLSFSGDLDLLDPEMVSREYLPWDSEYAYALVRKATQRHELPDANYLRLSTAVCGRRDGWCGGQTGQTSCEPG
jgi:hypothetical protein